MLQPFLRRWLVALLFASLTSIVFSLFSNDVAYANEESIDNTEVLHLESEVTVPDALWQSSSEDNAEESTEESIEESPEEEAPTMALIPPPPLDPPPLKQLTLMLDWYLSPQHAALVIAKERGLFAAQGLAVELQTPADPTIAIKLLAAGDVDLALTRQPLLHLHAHDGAPIARIGTLFETPLTAVIVSGEQHQGEDPLMHLEGLHYGFSTREGRDTVLQQVRPHSVQQIDTVMPPENVRFTATTALREGRVEAIADGFFHYLPPQLATEGIATHVVQYHELEIPRHDGLIIVANSDTATRRAPTWSRFLIALEEASYWIIDNPEAAWSLLTATHPVLDNAINAQAWEDLLRRMTLSPAALDTRRYKAFENFLLQAELIDAVLPVSRLAIDPHSI